MRHYHTTPKAPPEDNLPTSQKQSHRHSDKLDTPKCKTSLGGKKNQKQKDNAKRNEIGFFCIELARLIKIKMNASKPW